MQSQQQPQPDVPAELSNLDQLKVLLDTLPDYHADDDMPSYVLAIPCRPIVVALGGLLTGIACLQQVDWGALLSTETCGNGSY